MATIRQTHALPKSGSLSGSFAGWLSRFLAALKPRYGSADIALAVARSGNPTGA